MSFRNKIKPCFQTIVSCIFMMLSLAWLTVSTPFVYNSGLQKEIIVSAFPDEFPGDTEELPENPFTNSTEEKTESGTNSFSEYLHDAEEIFHSASDGVSFDKQFSTSLYIAFHGELLSPPPEMF